jgi:hypothetical protein
MKYWDKDKRIPLRMWFVIPPISTGFPPHPLWQYQLVACYIFVRYVHIDLSFSVGDKWRQVNNLLNKAKAFFNQANDSMTTYHQTNNTYFKDTVYSVGY